MYWEAIEISALLRNYIKKISGRSGLVKLLSEQFPGYGAIQELNRIQKLLEEDSIIEEKYIVQSNKKEDKNKEKKEIVIYKYSQMGKGQLHEAVLSNGLPFFTKYNKDSKKFELIEKIEENNRILKPPQREDYPYTPYEFSSLVEIDQYKDTILYNNINLDYLFQKCKAIISKYNNQDNYKITLVAADDLLSYFQDRFSTIHYDYMLGGNGSGKSSLGDTFGAIAYRAVNMTDPTAPNLFRLIGSVEPAQCTIILEEAERIDKSPELMAILKIGYSRNGRVSKINSYSLKQEFFFSYCLKVIISERSLSHSIAKGVNTRILPIHCFEGKTKYDIKEILNPTATGGANNKELLKEIDDFRKLLLIYRLIHFTDPIPDLDIGIEGRDKELVKHSIQLFYGSKCSEEITVSLQKFLDIKNQKKESTIESVILSIISDLIKYNGPEIKFKTFWGELIKNILGKEDEKKPNEYHTHDYGTIYRNTITGLICDTFGAKTKHERDGNLLIFDAQVIDKQSKIQDKNKNKIIINKLSHDNEKIASNKENDNDNDSYHNYNDVGNSQDIRCEGVKAVKAPDEGVPQKMDPVKKSTNTSSQIDSSILVNDKGDRKYEDNNSTSSLNAFTAFTHSHMNSKELKFNNPLISESDLATGNYSPTIINNIKRVHLKSDRWFCFNCTLIDDKWGMMRHLCKYNKKREEK